MQSLLGLSRVIDRINEFVGKNISWLILASVLISSGNATIRYTFNDSSNAWLEIQWYLYGAVFLLAAAYTLQKNEHIRIDFISNMLSKRTRDWIDLICHIVFLLPFTILIAYLAIPWVMKSISSGEVSANAGGLIIWPAKLMVAIGFVLLTAQGFSEIIKRWAVIRGLIDDPMEKHEMPPEVEEMLAGSGIAAGSDRSGEKRK